MGDLDLFADKDVTDHLDITLWSVHGILRDGKKFSIPHYQRGYRWPKEQVHQILSDIKESQENNDSYYLIGPATFIQSKKFEGRLDIVDGQQRLTTIALTLKILQRKISEMLDAGLKKYGVTSKDLDGRKLIQSQGFLERHFSLDTPDKLFLRYQRTSENDSFQQFFIDDRAREPRNERMKQAVSEITEFIESELTDVTTLREFSEHLLTRVWLASIAVNKLHAAYNLFESLNHKGERLKPIELVRNSIFMYMDDQYIDQCATLWDNLETVFLSTANGRSLDNQIRDLFLTYFECNSGGALEEKDLFQVVKNTFSNSKSSSNDKFSLFSDVVETSSRSFPSFYQAAVKPSTPLWTSWFGDQIDIHIKETLTSKRIFRSALASTFRAIHNGYTDTTAAIRFFEDLYKLIARTQVLGNIPVNKYSHILAAFSHDVFTENNETTFSNIALETIKKLCIQKPIIPNELFIQSLASNASLAKDKAKWLLRDIEYKEGKGKLTSLSKDIHAEHIFPENPCGRWKGFGNDAQFTTLNALGNFALLEGADNSAACNLKFSKKKDFYRDSSFILTREICEYSEWTKDTVQERSQHLAAKAADAWAFSFEKN